MRKRRIPLLLCLSVQLVAPQALAQDKYPSRPVRLVAPFPPGGGADFIGRELAQKLTEVWGLLAIVAERPIAVSHRSTSRLVSRRSFLSHLESTKNRWRINI
jgi:tripartite-type tricarboxylate transporter receptor subunit TctC